MYSVFYISSLYVRLAKKYNLYFVDTPRIFIIAHAIKKIRLYLQSINYLLYFQAFDDQARVLGRLDVEFPSRRMQFKQWIMRQLI